MTATKQASVSGKAFDFKLLKRVFTYVQPYRRNFIFSICITLFFAFIAPLRPWLVQYTFDHYIATPNPTLLLYMTLALIALLCIETLLQFLDSYLSNWLGQNIINDLRSKLYKHLLNLKLSYFDTTPVGTLVTRAVSDIETIADVFSEGLIVIAGDLLKLLVIVGVMFYTDVYLALISLATIPILLVATYFFKNAIKAAFQDVRTQVAKLNSFVQEHITGMSLVQIFNREALEFEKFKSINAMHRDANIRSIWHYSVFFPVVEILSSISLGLLVWWGGKGIFQNTVSIGELIAFIMYINMLFRPIRQLADRFNTLQMGMVSSERVFKLLDTDVSIENKGIADAQQLKGKIEFKNVWFAYTPNNWVLKNISFTVQPGETVAIVGVTGSGKSSIINLLNRFYEYDKGEILIDGINIRLYELNSLRKSIGVVLQDVFLFSDTLANNISLNNTNISINQIVEASKIIGAHDFIEKLPNGYDYNAMERGSMLSVGQRQLIAFIRAYVHDPKILVLDEATSSIDSQSEQLIQNATEKLTKNRTSIIIAHRLATIQKANKIITIDKGEIVEN